jgi:hypothetical protein
VAALWALSLCLAVEEAGAFPPYRSTDADTAEEGLLELRVGLVRVEHEDDKSAYASPLLRANLGVTKNAEFISEFEYSADRGRFSDGAVGLKWVPFRGFSSLGVETLVFVPVSSDQNGSGVESQLVATFGRKDIQLHLNAGGFYDARASDDEAGWRASTLSELQWGRFRPGLELFAKQVHSERVEVQAGVGLIVDVGPVVLRAGVHAGLTSEAPDIAASLWVTWKWSLW